jgi:hypothetical protein
MVLLNTMTAAEVETNLFEVVNHIMARKERIKNLNEPGDREIAMLLYRAGNSLCRAFF